MDAILEVGLANAAMVAVLAVAAAGLERMLRRPALVHSLWLLVLLKLVTPPLVAVPLFRPGPAANDDGPAVAEYVVVETVVVAGGVEAVPLAAAAAPAPEAGPPGWFESAGEAVEAWWRPAVASVWAAGSAAWLACAVGRVRRFRRLVDAAGPAPEDLQDRVDWLSGQLGLRRAPEARMVLGPLAPLVWSFGCAPKLLVPAGLWGRLDDEQRSTLLIHELAHLRRRDHWVRNLELAATALYWWHPAVWWARHALREAEEQCCDAWVVWAMPKAAKAYATALLETVDFLSEARAETLPIAASGFGHVEHLKRRLTMILRGITPRSLSWAGKLAITGLAATLLPILPTSAQQEPADVPKERDVKVVVTATGEAKEDVIILKKADGDARFEVIQGDGAVDIDALQPGRIVIKKGEGGGTFTIVGDDKDGPLPKIVRRLQVAKAEGGDKDKEDKSADASPEKKAEIEKARAEVEEAQATLRQAVEKLARLEGRKQFVYTLKTTVDAKAAADVAAKVKEGQDVFVVRPDGLKPVITPLPPGVAEIRTLPARVVVGHGAQSGQDAKVAELEKKLEALVKELESLKKKDD